VAYPFLIIGYISCIGAALDRGPSISPPWSKSPPWSNGNGGNAESSCSGAAGFAVIMGMLAAAFEGALIGCFVSAFGTAVRLKVWEKIRS
jgi:hypothetical protein